MRNTYVDIWTIIMIDLTCSCMCMYARTCAHQVIKYHIQFLDTCLKECLLTTSALLKVCVQNLSNCAATKKALYLVLPLFCCTSQLQRRFVCLFVQILSKLLISCILFAEQIKAFMESVTLDRRGKNQWIDCYIYVDISLKHVTFRANGPYFRCYSLVFFFITF